MSEGDRLAAALKQEQWAHTETAKRVAELEAALRHIALVSEDGGPDGALAAHLANAALKGDEAK